MAIDLDEPELTDEQLAAEAAREGSAGPAFVALLERHRDRVWRVCYRLMGDEHDANDAAQEVFVRMFLHRARFAGRSKYATWLHGMALRTCLELRRGRGRRRRRETTLPEAAWREPVTANGTNQIGLRIDLEQVLATLTEDERALVVLKYAEEYSYEELSELFEASVSACKMRVHRVLEKLRERFPDEPVTES